MLALLFSGAVRAGDPVRVEPAEVALGRLEPEPVAKGPVKGVRTTAPAVRGSLVIIGGAARHDHQELWGELIRLASLRSSRRRIAVIPAASRFPQKNGDMAVDVLNAAGGDAFLVPLAPSGLETDPHEVAKDPGWVAAVRQADGVFFIGGAQSRICETLLHEDERRTPMLDAIWEVYREGGVVAGTSAGAAVMSRIMFRDASYVLATMLHGVAMGKEIDRGLGFLDDGWFVDQHFLVRGRLARSLVAMRSQKLRYGVGIDEDSALVVERGAQARVIGQRGAVIMDLSAAQSDETRREFNLRNVKLTYLNRGDQIHLKTLEVKPSAAKLKEPKIDPLAPDFQPSLTRKLLFNDILANTVVVDAMRRLMDHKDGFAIGLAYDGGAVGAAGTRGFEFRFYRGRDSVGWQTDAQGGADMTIQNIHLDIRPVQIRGPLYEIGAIESPSGDATATETATGK